MQVDAVLWGWMGLIEGHVLQKQMWSYRGRWGFTEVDGVFQRCLGSQKGRLSLVEVDGVLCRQMRSYGGGWVLQRDMSYRSRCGLIEVDGVLQRWMGSFRGGRDLLEVDGVLQNLMGKSLLVHVVCRLYCKSINNVTMKAQTEIDKR